MDEESIFLAAIDKPTVRERHAFLDDACAGDLALRNRVERLLEAHKETRGILDQPATPPDSTEHHVRSHGGSPLGESVGAVIAGRYTLVEEVGAGGMGTVWNAEQTAPVRRTVAVKLIKAGMDSRSVLSRFEAERQVLALMEHPNIARVLDGGTTESGRPFFVMEYVKGVPFTRYCDDARLTVTQRLRLFVTVCQAVQHAHTKGVIHRDLKPGNILVSLYDGHPVPKVIDFGLAKAIQNPLDARTRHTAHGVLLGTPLYMSPEQAEFTKLDVDARSDIYSLGVILYELLTGTTPLERQRFEDVSPHELFRLIMEEEPARPSARLSSSELLPAVAAQRQIDPKKLTRVVRGELDWIVMKCLEKDRSRRYETANSLARDVERYLADERVEACPPSAGYRLRKFVSRHRGPVLALSIIFLLLVGGITGTTWGLIGAMRARKTAADRAEGERKANATAQKRLAQIEKGSEILASIFRDLDPQAEEKEGLPLRAILGNRLDNAAAALEGDAIGDLLVVASLQDRLARTYRALGHPAKAKLMFRRALATRRAQQGSAHPETLAVLSGYAQVLKDLGEFAECITVLEQVRDAQAQTPDISRRDALATLNDLGLAYWKVGKSNEACALLEQVRDALLKEFGPDDSATINALDSLSGVYMTLNKMTEAIALAQQVRDARVKAFGVDHAVSIAALNNLARRYQFAGKMKQALTLFEEAREAAVSKFGPDHPSTLVILDNLARLYRAFGRLPEAIKMAEQVRDARLKSSGAYHPDTINALDGLGLIYLGAEEPAKAVGAFEQAAAGLEKLDFVHVDAGMIIGNLCDCLDQLKQFDKADAWRRRWLAAVTKRDGPDSASAAGDLADQAEDMLRKRMHERAEGVLTECLAILQKKQPDSWRAFHARSLLGVALLAQKNYAEAEPLLVAGYEGLEAHAAQIPPLYAGQRVGEALERVITLYEVWGKPEKAAEWRDKLSNASDTEHGR